MKFQLDFFSEKETNEKFLQNLEEDQERDMRHLEESIRQEVNTTIRKIFLFIVRFSGTSKI